MGRIATALALALLALRGTALAHAATPALLELRELGEGRLDVRWKLPRLRSLAADPQPVLPAPCRPVDAPEVSEDDVSMTTRWVTDCGSEGLVSRRIGVDGLSEARTDALVRVVFADGHVFRSALTATAPFVTIPPGEAWLDVAYGYVRLGVEHILTGPDHLLFVFGLLLLVGTTRALLRTITAFTVGHSITLSLAVLGYARVPSGPIEVSIAFSVFVLAVELAREVDPSQTVLGRRPWLMALLFGLLHGLGFAGALREVGLPEHEIPTALLSFNVGIEIGQLAFVLAVLLLRRLARPLWERLPHWIEAVPTYAMGSLAALWVIERSVALL